MSVCKSWKHVSILTIIEAQVLPRRDLWVTMGPLRVFQLMEPLTLEYAAKFNIHAWVFWLGWSNEVGLTYHAVMRCLHCPCV